MAINITYSDVIFVHHTDQGVLNRLNDVVYVSSIIRS